MKQAARALTTILFFFLIASAVSILSNCGGSHSTTSSGATYFGTQSPGDAWSWTITRDSTGSGTFSGVNNTSGNTYSGSVLTLSNNFLQLTITTTTDSNVTPGSIAYAIEFPNTALMVKPAGVKDALIVAAAQGSCPSPASYNWIKVANQNWNVATDPAFGTAISTGAASNPVFSIAPYLLGDTALSTVTYSGSCSNGVITSNASTTFGVTPSGVFIGDQGTNGGIIGMLEPSTKIGSAAVLQQGRKFRGFVFMTHPPFESDGVTFQDKTQAIWSTTKGDNLITAGEYTDFAGGVEDTCPGGSSCATLSLDNEVAPGEFSGTMIDSHAGSHPFTLMVNQINGKYMIFGFSQNQAGTDPNALYPYLFLVMEQ